LDFADILRIHKYDPKEVRLARHGTSDGRMYLLWRNQFADYDIYCRTQRPENFGDQKYVAHFVVTPEGDTLFTGCFKLLEQKPIWGGLIHPLSGLDIFETENPRPIIYDVEKILEFDCYIGKLTIDWGKGTRNWSQIAGRTDKPVLEIRKQFIEPEFPGFAKFFCSSRKVSVLPEAWKSVLKANKGVYILVHAETQAQYVGSATGNDGFLGRWLNYEDNGHGGNVLLRKIKDPDFQISILDVCSSIDSPIEIIMREQDWKNKLGSRTFGLNGN